MYCVTSEQDGQCRHYYILATAVAAEKQSVLLHNMNMCVALIMQHAMCMHLLVICGLPYSTFLHIISLMARFSGKKLLNTKCVF
jgi:hypothetical protein